MNGGLKKIFFGTRFEISTTLSMKLNSSRVFNQYMTELETLRVQTPDKHLLSRQLSYEI